MEKKEMEWSETLKQLTAPFEDKYISFAPREMWEGKAKAYPYLEAPPIQVRLNSLLGLDWTWGVEYMPDGSVRGRLGIKNRDTGDWVCRDGVGAPSRFGFQSESFQVDLGEVANVDQAKAMLGIGTKLVRDLESTKAAETDAFKRAAMKFGIGNELWIDYQAFWCPYDSKTKRWGMSHEEMVSRARKSETASTESKNISSKPETTTSASVSDFYDFMSDL